MRLIDADALCEEFKKRQRAALRWKEEATNCGNEESAIRADATLAFLSEVKLTMDKTPTVDFKQWCEATGSEGCKICPFEDGKICLLAKEYMRGFNDGYAEGREAHNE